MSYAIDKDEDSSDSKVQVHSLVFHSSDTSLPFIYPIPPYKLVPSAPPDPFFRCNMQCKLHHTNCPNIQLTSNNDSEVNKSVSEYLLTIEGMRLYKTEQI